MPKQHVDFALIKQRASFSAVLDRYAIKHRRGAAQLIVNCPFHDDRVPSLSINTEKLIFHCFSCDASGDIVDFVARIEGCSTISAARLLAEWSGVPFDAGQQCTRAPKKPDDKAPRKDPSATEGRRPARAKPNKPLAFSLSLDPTHPYLKERGLTREVVETFGLGYCTIGTLRGRIAIPIHDEDGRLVAYAGRWPGDDVPEGMSRYRLPRGFKKSTVLFNLHRVRGAEHLVIVEGYWSVFRLHALGLPAVAVIGRSLSEAQEQLLLDAGPERLTLLLDGDEPGHLATEAILPRLARRFFVRTPRLLADEAPDTMPEERLLEVLSVK